MGLRCPRRQLPNERFLVHVALHRRSLHAHIALFITRFVALLNILLIVPFNVLLNVLFNALFPLDYDSGVS